MASLRNINAYKAYELDTEADFVHTAMLWMYINRAEPMLDSGFYHAKRALELNPNDALTNYNMAAFLNSASSRVTIGPGLDELAIKFKEKAIRLDPLDPNNYALLALDYYNLDQVEEAEKALETAQRLKSGRIAMGARIVYSLIQLGRLEEAESLVEIEERRWTNYARSEIMAKRGNYQEISEVFKHRNRVLLYAGKFNRLIVEAEKDIERGEDVFNFLNSRPDVEPLRNHPGFEGVLAKAKVLHEFYLAKYGDIKPID